MLIKGDADLSLKPENMKVALINNYCSYPMSRYTGLYMFTLTRLSIPTADTIHLKESFHQKQVISLPTAD